MELNRAGTAVCGYHLPLSDTNGNLVQLSWIFKAGCYILFRNPLLNHGFYFVLLFILSDNFSIVLRLLIL